jgi:hypothetical protein
MQTETEILRSVFMVGFPLNELTVEKLIGLASMLDGIVSGGIVSGGIVSGGIVSGGMESKLSDTFGV